MPSSEVRPRVLPSVVNTACAAGAPRFKLGGCGWPCVYCSECVSDLSQVISYRGTKAGQGKTCLRWKNNKMASRVLLQWLLLHSASGLRGNDQPLGLQGGREAGKAEDREEEGGVEGAGLRRLGQEVCCAPCPLSPPDRGHQAFNLVLRV